MSFLETSLFDKNIKPEVFPKKSNKQNVNSRKLGVPVTKVSKLSDEYEGVRTWHLK